MKPRRPGNSFDPYQLKDSETRYSAPNITEKAQTMPDDQYQTVKEVADRLQVGEATMRGWIKAGGLRAIEVGKG